MNLSEILTERLVQALGWTILHSLWQGALIALLLGVLMIVMRSYSSHVRYFVSVSALLTMFVLSVVTFVSAYQNYKPHTPSDFTLLVPTFVPTDTESVERLVKASVWENMWATAEPYFQEHLPLIVSVWLLGIVLLVLRFVGGYAYVQRLKHYQVREANTYWQGTLAYLATEIGVKQKVRLLESALAEMPMVIGWLKPVILLPVGTLSGLSIAQVESILAHELAHLKRHDYLVNIFQSLLEIVLFYNPFVWWVSGYIRQERENCCDDIAVEVTGDSLTLVKTLTMLEEFRLVRPQLAMGFAGRRQGGLLSRVRRLLSPKNRASGFSEGFLSAMVLVFCLGITTVNAYTPYNFRNLSAFANKSWEKVQNVASALVNNVLPTNAQAKGTETQEKAGKATETDEAREFLPTFKPLKRVELKDTIRFGNGFMAITDKKGNVTVFKEGKEIPKADFEKYKSEFSVVETPKKEGKGYIYYPADIDMPDLPAMPAMPSMPAMPAMPPMPNVFAPDVWEDVIVIENGKKVKRKKLKKGKGDKAPRAIIINPNGYEQSWENWGKQMEKWGEQYGKQWEGQYGKDWEEKWEKWGEEMEKWGEKYAKQFENMTEEEREAFEKNNKNRQKDYERMLERQEEARERHKEAMKRHEEAQERHKEAMKRHEEAQERHKEGMKRHEEITAQKQVLKDYFIKEGLIDANAKRLTLECNAEGIKVNGKAVTAEQEAKIRSIFVENAQDKNRKWTWIWEDDED